MTEKTQTAPVCGLYLKVPDDQPVGTILPKLRQAAMVMNRSAHGKNMHAFELGANPDDPESITRLEALVEILQLQGMIALVRGDFKLARAAGADGVTLDSGSSIGMARDYLGEKAIISVRCGDSVDLAAQAIENSADIVTFGTGKSMPSPVTVAKWAMQDAPCMVEGPVTNDDCARYVQAGALFVDATDYVWNHPKGVMQGVVNMMHAIDLAAESRAQH